MASQLPSLLLDMRTMNKFGLLSLFATFCLVFLKREWRGLAWHEIWRTVHETGRPCISWEILWPGLKFMSRHSRWEVALSASNVASLTSPRRNFLVISEFILLTSFIFWMRNWCWALIAFKKNKTPSSLLPAKDFIIYSMSARKELMVLAITKRKGRYQKPPDIFFLNPSTHIRYNNSWCSDNSFPNRM